MSKEIELLTEIRDLLVEIRDEKKPKPTKKRREKSSKFNGVTYCRTTESWRSQIYVDGKVKALGYYDQEVDAASAYDRAVIKFGGNKKKINFKQSVIPTQKTNISDALASLKE